MKKKNLLLTTAMLLLAGYTAAQDAGEVTSLLPDGVTANINSERKMGKQKNLIVAGSPEKGYKAFFAATDATHGEELWVTDGTVAGTHMVKDIVGGTGGSNPSYLGRLNDKVLFSAYTDDTGQELWVSDGTEEGTFMLADTYMVGDGDPKGFCQVNETQAVFSATDDESAEYDVDRGKQQWLWVTDGSANGTKRIYQCDVKNPGQDNTNLHTPYVRVGRRVFFKADNIDGTTGEELWVTDGTTSGTKFVKDINLEPDPTRTGVTRNSALDNMENFQNERLFFSAWTMAAGNEPWTSDGTEEGTYMIKDTNPNVDPNTSLGIGGGVFGPGWEVYKGRIWYRGWDSVGGYELAGTNCQLDDNKFFDIYTLAPSVDNNSYPDPGCIFDGVYMFCAASGFDATKSDNHGGELHYFDGETVKEQYDLCPGTGCDWVKEQTVAGGSMYWYNEANDVAGGFGSGLYRLDSKDDVPVVCPTITATGDFIHSLRNLGGTIIYSSTTTNGLYVYKYTKPDWDGKTDVGFLEPEYRTPSEIETYIKSVSDQNETNGNVNVFNIDGKIIRQNVALDKATENLQKGVYIVGNKKYVVR
jgi:ELWxxDGT repeat protein